MLCGFAELENRSRQANQRLPRTAAELERIRREAYKRADLRRLPLPNLLEFLFRLSDDPFELDELVGLVADLCGVYDLQRVADSEDSADMLESLPDQRVDVATLVERRMYLSALWEEICQLRCRQRAALLLNLHDSSGQDMLPLLVLVGTVSLRDVAGSLAIPMDEFLELWNRLPLDDATIAERLNVTRQQVINLRKSARERLARRMARR